MVASLIRRGEHAGAEMGDERLLRLYWNRAEVKKELARLRRERHELLERVNDREADTQRVKEQLESLERLLADRHAAASAIVHFQLRHLWRTASDKVRRFGGELAEKQERRESERLESEFRRRQSLRIVDLDRQARSAETELTDLEQRVEALRRLQAGLPFWRVVRRRELRNQLDGLETRLAEQRGEHESLRRQRQVLVEEPCPEFPGLSLESRRLLNLAIIAMAQELVLFFSAEDVAVRARAAMTEDVRNADYGAREVCERLSRHVDERLAALGEAGDLNARVKRRTEFLRASVEYRREDESVPLAQSLSDIPKRPLASEKDCVAVNVLADEYWDLYEALH